MEGVPLAIGFAPTGGTHVVSAAGTEELVGMAIAVEVSVVVEVGVDGVLGLHEFGQVAGGQLAAHGQIDLAVLVRAGQVVVHVSCRLKIFIMSREAFHMLTFHGLAVDRRMAGVLDVRIGSDGVLNCGHVGLGGCGTVGVDLYALSLGVEEFDEIGEHVGSNVLRASKAYEVIRLFEAVFRRIILPVIIAGGLHPRCVSLRRAVKEELVGTEHKIIGRQVSRDFRIADVPACDVIANLGCIGGVREFAITGVLPAHGLTVGRSHGVNNGTIRQSIAIVAKGMNEDTEIELVGVQSVLECGNLLCLCTAAVGGRYACRRINLRCPGNTKVVVGFEFIGKGNETHGLRFEEYAGGLSRGVLFNTFCRCCGGYIIFLQSERVGRPHMAGDVRNVDRMGGAGLVQIIAGRMALFGKLRIVVVPADNRAASGKGFGLFAQLLNELVHRVYSAVEQRTVQVDLIEVTSTLSREVPMPVNETGQHGLAAQIDNLIDLILIEIPLSLGIRFRTHKNDFAVQSCNDVNLFCILNVFSFLHRFRNRVDFTIAVYGVSDLVGSVQLHTAAKNHRHDGRERQRLLLYTVFHECSSCKKLTLPGAFLLVPFPDSDSRKAYFPDFG